MDLPWEADAVYSECGQTFFSAASVHAHEAICGYCIRAKKGDKNDG